MHSPLLKRIALIIMIFAIAAPAPAQVADSTAKPSTTAAVTARKGKPSWKTAGKGAFVKHKSKERVKNAKIILAETDDPVLDSMLANAVRTCWTFNRNITSVPYNKARALAKKDRSILIFGVTDVFSTEFLHLSPEERLERDKYPWVNRPDVSSGSSVILEDGKGVPVVAGYFPKFGEQEFVTEEALFFAVSAMNSLLTSLEVHGIRNNLTYNKPFKRNAPGLAGKTLLILDKWLAEDVSPAEIGKYYNSRFKVVSYEDWSRAIVERADFAYAIVVPAPINGSFVYQHYLMDAKSGMVYYIAQPKVAVSVMKKNVSASNTGYINSRNLKDYNTAFAGIKESNEHAAATGD